MKRTMFSNSLLGPLTVCLALVAWGCGGGAAPSPGDAATATATDTAVGGGETDTRSGGDDTTELVGTWLYAGSAVGEAGDLVVGQDHVVESARGAQGAVVTTWAILGHDNVLNRIHLRHEHVTGAPDGYPFFPGMDLFASYRLEGGRLAVYFATDDYPPPAGGIEGVDYFDYVRRGDDTGGVSSYAGAYDGGVGADGVHGGGRLNVAVLPDGSISASAHEGSDWFHGEGQLSDDGSATMALAGSGLAEGVIVTYTGSFRVENGNRLGWGTWESSQGSTGYWGVWREDSDLGIPSAMLDAACTSLDANCARMHPERCPATFGCAAGFFAAKSGDCLAYYESLLADMSAVASAEGCGWVFEIVEGDYPTRWESLDCPRAGFAACGDPACEVDCEGRVCGDDGCGGTCGTCLAGEACDAEGQCVCVPDCGARACGDDGCGGSCGSCGDGEACDEAGHCVCAPACEDRDCGDDGCGGSCGTCGGQRMCGDDGRCVDEPPSVRFVAPADGATVTGPTRIIIDASDDGPSAPRLELFVGDERMTGLVDGELDWTPPFHEGAYNLLAVALDDAEQRTEAAITVHVDYLLTIVLEHCLGGSGCTPLGDGAQLRGHVELQVVMEDDGDGGGEVEFLVDGAVVATDEEAPYELSWDTRTLAIGDHLLLARARTADGETAEVSRTVVVLDCDSDDDGHFDIAFPCGGDDCDDGDDTRHPGADDLAGDGVDQNCDDLDGVDADGDGHASVVSGGDDCADEDETRHPEANDTVGDGIDQNCDDLDGVDTDGDGHASAASGGDDCDDEDETRFYGAPDTVGDDVDQSCDDLDGIDSDGDGHASVASGGDDCADDAPGVHPDAADTVGDDADQNCDGADGVDADGDGYASEASGGDDCDDDNAAVFPDCGERECGVDPSCGTPCGECGGGTSCALGACVAPGPGDLLITEIMREEAGTTGEGEWIELFNTTDGPFNLSGCELDSDDTDGHHFDGNLIIEGGGYLVLARSADPERNHGLEFDYVYEHFRLDNGGDEVVLVCFDVVVDEVRFGDGPGFPDDRGYAMSLARSAYDHLGNDAPESWCSAHAEDPYGDGSNYGTPGAENPPCGDVEPVDWCRLEEPRILDGHAGAVVTIVGRVREAGVTDATSANDPSDLLRAQVGYGADGSDPSLDYRWTWHAAAPTPGWDGAAAGAPDSDEYATTFPAPAPGDYAFAYRFSADGGATWLYCDGDGSDDGYDPADGGVMTTAASSCYPNPCLAPPPPDCATDGVTIRMFDGPGGCSVTGAETYDCAWPFEGYDCSAAGGTCAEGACVGGARTPAVGELVITEILYNPNRSDTGKEWFELLNVSDGWLTLDGCVLTDDDDSHTLMGSPVFAVAPGATILLAMSDDPEANGGIAPDYVYGEAFELGSPSDRLAVTCADVLIDAVAYDGDAGWPDLPGASLRLDPLLTDATLNDVATRWCWGVERYGTFEDKGTPGLPNPDCGGRPELVGGWSYAGSAEGPGDLFIDLDTVVETMASTNGPAISTWVITALYNGGDQMRLRHEHVENPPEGYPYTDGQELYTAYRLDGDTLYFYLNSETNDYPTPEGGVEGVDYYLYVRASTGG